MILDKLEKLRARERVGLAVAALCILALLTDYLVVRPTVRGLKALDMEIEREDQELAYNLRVLRWQDRIRADFERVEGLIGTSAPSAEELDRMTGDIDDLARETGVDLPSLGTLAPKSHEGIYEEYAVEVKTFDADTKGLLGFLHECVLRPGLMRVSKLALEPDATGTRFKGSMLITKVMLTAGQ